MDSGAECPWPFFIVRPIFSLGSDGALIVHGVGTSSNTSRQPVPEVKHLLTPPMNQPLLFCCRLRAASCSPAPSQRYLRQMPDRDHRRHRQRPESHWCASQYRGRIKWSGVRSGAHPDHSVRLDQHVAVTLDATCLQSYSHQRCPPPNTTLRQPRSPARSAPALGGAFITGSAKVAPGDSSSHRAYS